MGRVFRIRSVLRLSFCFAVLIVALLLLFSSFKDELNESFDRWHFPFFNPEPKSSLRSPFDIFELDGDETAVRHPIDDLIDRANEEFEALAHQATSGVAAAAKAYRKRRGQHPPPNFDHWVAFAETNKCIVIEELFDPIYHDLNPFWGIPAEEIRTAASNLPNRIAIRDGTITKTSDKWQFVDIYFDMFKEIASLLPDVDIPINEMDESRLLIQWEVVNSYMASVQAHLSARDLSTIPTNDTFLSLRKEEPNSFDYAWNHNGPYWNLARAACPPESYARDAQLDADFGTPPQFPSTWPNGTYMGYVSNWTVAKDPCVHPHLRNLHGTFVEPISQATSVKLFPIFSGSKLPMNNDILLPAAIYWSEEERFAAGKKRVPWHEKRNEVVRRGSASGGRNTKDNWTRFQRHRLLSMLNGTQIQMTLARAKDSQGPVSEAKEDGDDEIPQNFPLPNQTLYPLRSHNLGLLHEWIRTFSNAAFTWLNCFPKTRDYGCSYTGSWYRRGRPMPMHRLFHAKYLPDVDGNSFSGRYRAFLNSNSLPIKSTIYNEWHDSRLIPWKHFVPMDNTNVDFWAILEYLFRNDERGRRIAEEGRNWAERVLRREDMLCYVYRLVLEYARVSDGRRWEMGFADDLGVP